MNLTINRNIQPPIQPIKSINGINPDLFELDNGLETYLLNLGTQDLVKIELVFEAGIAYQNAKLISSFTNKMLDKGTKSFTAFEIAENFDNYGAYFSSYIDKDYASVALYCLTKHLDKLLPVFTEIVYEPTFPENELFILANKSKQEFIINLKKVKTLAHLNFPSLIFGDKHPYGQKAEIKDFDAVKTQDIRSFYQTHYLNRGCKLIVSGKLEPNISQKINQTFGQFKIKTKPVTSTPDFSNKNTPGLHQHIEINDALQSAIWIGKPMLKKTSPDFIGMQVLNTALGGYFGSRLMSNIREDKGYTYGISSSLTAYKNDGAFTIQTEVGAKYTEATLVEIYREIENLQEKEINEVELELIKNYISGQLIRGLDGPFAVHEKLKKAILYDLNPDYYQHFLKEVMAITPKKIKQLANEYLAKNSLAELVVGK